MKKKKKLMKKMITDDSNKVENNKCSKMIKTYLV